MYRLALIVGLTLTLIGSAYSQQRVMNQGTTGVLREWPVSGAWAVVLARTNGELSCAMFTGHRDDRVGETYVWGIRNRGGQSAIVVSDKNAEAVAGASVRVSFDGIPAGTYLATIRKDVGDMHSVAAPLDRSEFDRVGKLLRIAGAVTYSTGTANYSAPLAGAAQALGYLAQCTAEVEHLTGSGT